MASPATWQSVLRDAGFWRWSAAAHVNRMTSMMAAFAFVVAAETWGARDGLGGFMVSAFILPTVVMGPINGRLFDRFGVRRGLAVQGIIGGTIVLLLAAALRGGWGDPAIVGLCVLLGVVGAGSGGGIRAALNPMVQPGAADRSMAVDAMLLEIAVVVAPLLVVAVTVAGSLGGVITMAVFFFVAAGLAWIWLPERAHIDATGMIGERSPLLRSAAFWFWLIVSATFGLALGLIEIGAVELADGIGRGPGTGALFVAAVAVTSVPAGLAWGAWSDRVLDRLQPIAVLMLGVLAIVSIAIGLLESLTSLAIAMILIGPAVAPIAIMRQQATDRLTQPSQRAEAFATVFAANGLGFAAAGLAIGALPLPLAFATPILPAVACAALWARGRKAL